MKTKLPIKSDTVQKLVERGYALHLQINRLTEEFKSIKDRLKAEALTHPEEHLPLTGGSQGEQWIASASHCECRIVFPAPRLKTEIDSSMSEFATIKTLAGRELPALFRELALLQVIDRDQFRDQVTCRLPDFASRRLLELCTTPSEPKAVWKERLLQKKSTTR